MADTAAMRESCERT